MFKWIFVFAFLSFLLPEQLVSQSRSKTVRVVVGEEEKGSKLPSLDAEPDLQRDVMRNGKLGLVSVKMQAKGLKTKFTVSKFSNRMIPGDPVESSIKEKKKRVDHEFCLKLNNKMNCFFSSHNQWNKEKTLFMRSINKRSLSLEEERTEIMKSEASPIEDNLFFDIKYEVSSDSTKLLIIYTMPFDEHKNRKYAMHVLNDQFEEIWSEEVEMPYENNMTDLADFEVDNEGNVFMLSRIYVKKKLGILRRPSWNYELFSYFDKGKTQNQHRIFIDGYVMGAAEMEFDEDQELVFVGYYSGENSFDPTGLFFMKFDTESQKELIRNYENAGFDIENYNLTGVLLKDDGGAFLVGENVYSHTKTNPDGSKSGGGAFVGKAGEFSHDNILAVSFSPDGKVDWGEKVIKRQSCGTGFASFASIVQGDKLHLLFNDHHKNANNNTKEKYKRLERNKGNSNLVMVTLDAKGDQKKEVLFTAEDKDCWAQPRHNWLISPNEMVILGVDSKPILTKLIFK